MEPFAQRAIDVVLTPQQGSMAGQSITLSGYRVVANTTAYINNVKGRLEALVFGLPIDTISNLSRAAMIGARTAETKIIVNAGDVGGQMSTFYDGQIWSAYGDFNSMPDVPLVVMAQASVVGAMKPAKPTTFIGSVSAAMILAGLASQMGIAFVNNGVTAVLSNPYFHGTAYDQFVACCEAAHVSMDLTGSSVTVFPSTGYRNGEPIPVSPETGMVAYPAFSRTGIMLTTVYNPNVQKGGRVQVTSSIKAACGVWIVYGVAHSLASQMPDGPWFTQIMCYSKVNA